MKLTSFILVCLAFKLWKRCYFTVYTYKSLIAIYYCARLAAASMSSAYLYLEVSSYVDFFQNSENLRRNTME